MHGSTLPKTQPFLCGTTKLFEETRQVRDGYAAKFDYDLEAIYRDLKKQEEQNPEKFTSLSLGEN
jgi:hypothetical protein